VYAEPFDYAAAGSWDEAVELLRHNGEEARVIAGGQSLIPMMTLRLAMPAFLVDVNGADRSRIERKEDRIAVSAVTRHSELEGSPVLSADCPMLAEAASLVGNIRVRHRGTIGGSLAHADPAAELPCAAVALGADILTLGPDGGRRIGAGEFFDSFFTTALQPGEIVTGLEVPTMPRGTGWSFLELLRRTSDFAVVAVAALVTLDGKGRCTGAKLAAAGVGDRPVDLTHVAEPLLGQPVEDPSVAEAGRRAAAAVEPPAAVHASSEYRRAMLEVMVRRAVVQAAGRARGGAG
jgi:aerobic carbon-monoxide dehydrogenase medium subunit